MRKVAYGFTLTELLITVCVAVIISTLALPSLSSYLSSNRQENLRHSLLSHLKATRSEAVTLMQRVELCGSSNGLRCDQEWSDGWLLRDPITGTALRFSRQPGRERLHWVGVGPNSQSVIYQANGTTVASNGRFILCSAEGLVSWQVVINRQGRVRHFQGLEKAQTDAELCR